MRRADVPRALAAAALLAFALAACFCPQLFAASREARGPMGLAFGVLATVFAAKLTIPVSWFGRGEALAAPMVLALAAPYFFGLLGLDALMRRRAGLRTPPAAPARPTADSPYDLSARVATALAAAARARR